MHFQTNEKTKTEEDLGRSIDEKNQENSNLHTQVQVMCLNNLSVFSWTLNLFAICKVTFKYKQTVSVYLGEL